MTYSMCAVRLTSGLDSLASVRTRAVALTEWASSCSTSLWVLADSRILGRKSSSRESCNYFHQAERAPLWWLLWQFVLASWSDKKPYFSPLWVQFEEDALPWFWPNVFSLSHYILPSTSCTEKICFFYEQIQIIMILFLDLTEKIGIAKLGRVGWSEEHKQFVLSVQRKKQHRH